MRAIGKIAGKFLLLFSFLLFPGCLRVLGLGATAVDTEAAAPLELAAAEAATLGLRAELNPGDPLVEQSRTRRVAVEDVPEAELPSLGAHNEEIELRFEPIETRVGRRLAGDEEFNSRLSPMRGRPDGRVEWMRGGYYQELTPAAQLQRRMDLIRDELAGFEPLPPLDPPSYVPARFHDRWRAYAVMMQDMNHRSEAVRDYEWANFHWNYRNGSLPEYLQHIGRDTDPYERIEDPSSNN